MELTGETMLAAPRDRVWAALNDPAVLARCIEGVETLTASTDAERRPCFTGTMQARVGPVRATFAGTVTITESEPPSRYVLSGEGKGGVAGFAGGAAEVRLSTARDADAPATRLEYTVTSTVGGKLAQLGARLIEGAARGYAEAFFAKLKVELESVAVDVATPSSVEPAVADTDADQLHDSRPRSGLTLLLWTTVVILIVLVVLAWQLR